SAGPDRWNCVVQDRSPGGSHSHVENRASEERTSPAKLAAFNGTSTMKTGMNLLLWTDHVTEAQDPLLDQIKALGFDSVEIPIFATEELAPYQRLGKRLQGLGLKATAVTVMGPQANPISSDPKV